MTLNILLVDDDEDDHFLTRKALDRGALRHVLDIARDGREALAFLRHEAPFQNRSLPDVVLLDINMPRLDGLETLRQIRADSGLARLPVIMLTTSDADRDVLKAFEDGATGYYRKPIRGPELAAVVRDTVAIEARA